MPCIYFCANKIIKIIEYMRCNSKYPTNFGMHFFYKQEKNKRECNILGCTFFCTNSSIIYLANYLKYLNWYNISANVQVCRLLLQVHVLSALGEYHCFYTHALASSFMRYCPPVAWAPVTRTFQMELLQRSGDGRRGVRVPQLICARENNNGAMVVKVWTNNGKLLEFVPGPSYYTLSLVAPPRATCWRGLCVCVGLLALCLVPPTSSKISKIPITSDH